VIRGLKHETTTAAQMRMVLTRLGEKLAMV